MGKSGNMSQRTISDLLQKVSLGKIGQKLAIAGDSTHVGVCSSPFEGSHHMHARQYSPCVVAASLLNDTGISCRSDAFFGSSGMSTVQQYAEYNTDVTFSHGWEVEFGYFLGGGMFFNSSTWGPDYPITLHPTKEADRFEIYYSSAPGMSELVVSDVHDILLTVNCDADVAVRKATVMRRTPDIRPIYIWKRSPGLVSINGIDPWNSGVAELRMLNLSASGWRSGDYGLKIKPTSAWYGIMTVKPDFTYIEYGVNDKALGATIPGFIANLEERLNDAFRSGGAALGISAPAAANSSFDLSIEWRNSVLELASKREIDCIDIYSLFGSAEIAPDNYADDVHLTIKGSALKGRVLADWIFMAA